MTRRFGITALWIAAALVGACACGTAPEPSAQTIDDELVPYGLLDRDVPPLVPPATAQVTEQVQLCFVLDGDLTVVATPLEPPVDLDQVVEALIEPPESAQPSVRTAVGPPPLVAGVRLRAGVADVDLRPAITELAGDEQLLAVAQLVCTLTNQPGVGTVSFTLEGAPIDVPRGDGSSTSSPVSRDDYADLLS